MPRWRVSEAPWPTTIDVWNDNGRVALNARWAAQLEDAGKRCAGTPQEEEENAAPWALVFGVGLVAVVAIVFIGLKVDDALAPTELEAPLLSAEQPSMEEDLELLTSPQSLATNAPFYMKVLLPLGLVLTTALFIWSHVAYAATVKLRGTLTTKCRPGGRRRVLHLGKPLQVFAYFVLEKTCGRLMCMFWLCWWLCVRASGPIPK